MANILIVDDEKDIVSALKIYLSSEQHTTFSAYTGKEALAILEKEEIHLVLMDIMMPEMDGVTALSILRERELNVPVILLTAKSEDSDKILGLNIGADDYVTKPFNPVELLARVRSQLRRSPSPPPSTRSCGCSGPARARSSPPRRSTAKSGKKTPSAPTRPLPFISATCGKRSR